MQYKQIPYDNKNWEIYEVVRTKGERYFGFGISICGMALFFLPLFIESGGLLAWLCFGSFGLAMIAFAVYIIYGRHTYIFDHEDGVFVKKIDVGKKITHSDMYILKDYDKMIIVKDDTGEDTKYELFFEGPNGRKLVSSCVVHSSALELGHFIAEKIGFPLDDQVKESRKKAKS